MTKQELFKKYSVNETHNQWGSIDSRTSVEIYRIMHDGQLPPPQDTSVKWVVDFLDRQNDMLWWSRELMGRPDWGNWYLTAKRMVYKFADQILEELK